VPEAEIRARGGLTRVRTQKLPNGRYRKIYVVRDAGPEGGHTVAGPAKKRDDAPKYRVKPDPEPWALRRKRKDADKTK